MRKTTSTGTRTKLIRLRVKALLIGLGPLFPLISATFYYWPGVLSSSGEDRKAIFWIRSD